MTTKLRWNLALHAITASIVICYAIWSLFTSWAELYRDYHLLASAVSAMVWAWLWWAAVRTWPVSERRLQPERRFNPLPGGAVFIAQICLLIFFLGNSWERLDFSVVLLWADFGLLVSFLFAGLSWLAAGIRFHVGTWMTCCLWNAVGLLGIAWIVGQRMMNAG